MSGGMSEFSRSLLQSSHGHHEGESTPRLKKMKGPPRKKFQTMDSTISQISNPSQQSSQQSFGNSIFSSHSEKLLPSSHQNPSKSKLTNDSQYF